MRHFCGLILLAYLASFTGCGNKAEPAPAAATTSSPAPASGNYLGALAAGQRSAVKNIDTASLNQAIQLFNAQEGRNPADLNELVTKNYIGKLPDPPYGMKLSYDPATGKVAVVPK